MNKMMIAMLIMLSCGVMMFACSNEGQDETDETERRIEVESFELDEEAEFAKRQGQVGFFSAYDTKYAFAEAEITELEDTFFAPYTVDMGYSDRRFYSHLYCEGEDGDMFVYDLVPAYDEDGERIIGNGINGILRIDKYGSAERICIDPYCIDEEAVCNHMNLYGHPWGYHDNSLYFLCPKWYDEKGILGSYLLEYSLDDREFYKILDIPAGNSETMQIIDGYAYIWCYNGGSSEVLKRGQSAVAVVDLEENRACIYEDDIPIVCGILEGGLIAAYMDPSGQSSTPTLIDPNTKKYTYLSTHTGGWNSNSCALTDNYIVYTTIQTYELMIYDTEIESVKSIDEDVYQFKTGDNKIWYQKTDNSLYCYNPEDKKRTSIAKDVRDFIVRGDSCLYITSSNTDVDVLHYTRMKWVWSDDGETREYKEVTEDVHAYSDVSLWCFTDGTTKRLYQTKENEYIRSMFYCWIGEEYAAAEILVYHGEIKSYIDGYLLRMRTVGGKNEVIGSTYGDSEYMMYEIIS